LSSPMDWIITPPPTFQAHHYWHKNTENNNTFIFVWKKTHFHSQDNNPIFAFSPTVVVS